MKILSHLPSEIQQGVTDTFNLVMNLFQIVYTRLRQMRIYFKWEKLGKYK